MKINESEVSSGNASGKAGVASLPFGRGYYSSGGNNGAPGITFTPSGEPSYKTYKSMKHSKKNLKKLKRFKEYINENISQKSLVNLLNNQLMKKFKEFINEDASATMGNSNGMGAVVSAQPSSTPGDVGGSSIGSGDIGSKPFGIYSKSSTRLKKDKKKNIKSFKKFQPRNVGGSV